MAQDVHLKISETINEVPASFSLASIPESRVRVHAPSSSLSEAQSPKAESGSNGNLAVKDTNAPEKSTQLLHSPSGMREGATLAPSESRLLFMDTEHHVKMRKSTANKRNMNFEDLIEIPRVAELLNRCNDFNWPIFEFSDCVAGKPLSCLAFYLFKKESLFSHFQIPPDKFWKFITTIEQGYHSDIPCKFLLVLCVNS
ncbi:hypothetical protein BC829DRAFT_31813 [Chytridium lagenaria]|nr:hypothetical protein BC829DRAFT_31813 [Chytridium lagenaria]